MEQPRALDLERRQAVHRSVEHFLLQPPGEAARIPVEDARALIQQLRVQYVELQAQNEELRRLQFEAHAQRTEQVRSRQQLAGSVAHHVNRALATIVGSASMALEALSPGATARGYVEDIEVAATRAVSLSDQLLAYAGRTTIAVEPLGVSEAIRDTQPMLDTVAAPHATIDFSLATDLPAVIANRTQIQQVVMNLVANASEALIGDSVIHLRTTSVVLTACDLASMTHADEAAPGRFVRLDVSDAGTGLTSDTRQRMFEPFFSTKVAGRGLGLAAVLGIVNRHRGAIDVESRVGHGTRVSILLPAAASETSAVAATIAHPVVARPRGTALVVDDACVERWVMLTVLNRSGMRVLEAADGHQAIDACKEYGSGIDVVLLDLDMPGPPASEVMREISRLAPEARIVLTSDHSPAEGAEAGGGAAFLQKPCTAAALLAGVLMPV